MLWEQRVGEWDLARLALVLKLMLFPSVLFTVSIEETWQGIREKHTVKRTGQGNGQKMNPSTAVARKVISILSLVWPFPFSSRLPCNLTTQLLNPKEAVNNRERRWGQGHIFWRLSRLPLPYLYLSFTSILKRVGERIIKQEEVNEREDERTRDRNGNREQVPGRFAAAACYRSLALSVSISSPKLFPFNGEKN